MDEWVIVASDGEESQTVCCKEEDILNYVNHFAKDENTLVITIVRVIAEEEYQS